MDRFDHRKNGIHNMASLKVWILRNLGLPDKIRLSTTELWEYKRVEFWLDVREGNPAFVIDLAEFPGSWLDPRTGEEGDLIKLVQMVLMVDQAQAELKVNRIIL